MALDKKEYEEKMEEMRKGKNEKILKINFLFSILLELRDSRNEYDAAEKRFEAAQDEQQKCLNEFKEKVILRLCCIIIDYFLIGRNI